MIKINRLCYALGLSLFCGVLWGKNKTKGPVIVDFGAVYEVKSPDFKLDVTKEYKAVFDVLESPEGHSSINASIETPARFLNMHAQAGIPITQLHVALVVHGTASKDILNNEAYIKKYGTENPNAALIGAILNAGGKIILCGQSAAGRGIAKEELIPGVQLALSAMTALVQLQDEDYRLIKF